MFKLTFFWSVLALALFVNASQIDVHARMIKKRQTPTDSDSIIPGVVIGAGEDPNSASTTPVSQTAQPTSAAAGQSTDGGLLGGILPSVSIGNPLSRSSASATPSSSSSVSSSASSSASSSSASSSASSSSSSSSSAAPSSESNVMVTVTYTSAPQQTASSIPVDTKSNTAASSNTSRLSTKTVVALVVVASSIAGIAIIWTVIRKWKLGTSKEFNDRLNPIDWQPTGDPEMSQHRRSNSRDSGRSFGNLSSSNHHGSGGMISDLPNHDFTAGPAHGYESRLAPVGAYADLQRGPSPAPSTHYNGYGATQYGRNGY